MNCGPTHDEFTGLAGDDFIVMEVEDAAFGERERFVRWM